MIEDTQLRELLRAAAQDASLPSVMPPSMRRAVMVRRARTIGVTLTATLVVTLTGAQGVRSLTTVDEAGPDRTAGRPRVALGIETFDRTLRDVRPVAAPPDSPYLIDLTTRVMTPLPDEIVEAVAPSRRFNRFAASPDGSELAFVGRDEDGHPQIFVAGLDGSRMRQLTSDPKRASSPSWSPDGTRIAYEGYGRGEALNVFVVDVASGETSQITHGSPPCFCALEPQFTPDGSSIIFGGGTNTTPVVRTVRASGGGSSILLGPGEGLEDAGNASISPDGSLLTFLGGGYPLPDRRGFHCGPCRLIAKPDGTDIRVVVGWMADPAGTWSPDGTRIVSTDGADLPTRVVVVDVATGDASLVATGTSAIWVDDGTLLVDR